MNERVFVFCFPSLPSNDCAPSSRAHFPGSFRVGTFLNHSHGCISMCLVCLFGLLSGYAFDPMLPFCQRAIIGSRDSGNGARGLLPGSGRRGSVAFTISARSGVRVHLCAKVCGCALKKNEAKKKKIKQG